MAENLPIEGEPKTYPRRNKKTLFDEETWEVSTSKKNKRKNKKSTTENGKFGENNKSKEDEPFCMKCLLVCKTKQELNKHEEDCFRRTNKLESFLKYHFEKQANPRVVVEKVVVPPSESSETGRQECEQSSPSKHEVSGPSYAEITGRGTPEGKVQTLKAPPKQKPKIPVKKKGENNKNKIPVNTSIQHPPHVETEAEDTSSTAVLENATASLTRTDKSIADAYEEVVRWKRNFFDLPKGNLGKKFIDELTKQLNKWTPTKDNKYLKLAMIMPSLLLQRSAKGCKGRIHKENLQRRLELWENGQYDELVNEGKCIQSRLRGSPVMTR